LKYYGALALAKLNQILCGTIMLVKICRCQDYPEHFEVKIEFVDKTEWHLSELIGRHFEDIFPEENIKRLFDSYNNDTTRICSFSAKSYYYMLQILWAYKICKYDPNTHDAYFGRLNNT
jgi:hypothetical protein